MRRIFTDGTPNLTLIWVWLSRKSAMRGRRRLYSAFLLSTIFLLLLSWVNKHRLLPGNQVRYLHSHTVAIVLHALCTFHTMLYLAAHGVRGEALCLFICGLSE